MKTQSAKAKGRKLQQWVRDMILVAFPKLEKDDVKSTSMGVSGEDIQLSPMARKSFPFSVECKSRKKIGVYDFMDQASKNCNESYEPLLFIKADYRSPLVCLDAELFFNLLVDKVENKKSR